VVKVLLSNAADAAALESITATMTGAGLISPDGSTWGKSFVIQTAQSDPAAQIRMRADGTAGVGSLAISSPALHSQRRQSPSTQRLQRQLQLQY